VGAELGKRIASQGAAACELTRDHNPITSVRNTDTLHAMPSPIPRTSVPDHVFDQLREAILTGRYRPGERLPTQRALAADLEVNLASVREALKRLEQLRLVEVRHGDATRVLDWRRSGGLEALVLHGGATALGDDLFEARRLLLVEAARLAAVRRSEQQAQSLRELAVAVQVASEDATALLADWAFMAALVEAAGNLVFQLIMNSVRELYLPHAQAFAPLVSHRDELAGQYMAAARAVSDGDADGAASAIDQLATAQTAWIGVRRG
jgi:GntR family transcriptional regulator, transcriptional repressor for pyruvate dehydrogenase complex